MNLKAALGITGFDPEGIHAFTDQLRRLADDLDSGAVTCEEVETSMQTERRGSGHCPTGRYKLNLTLNDLRRDRRTSPPLRVPKEAIAAAVDGPAFRLGAL